MTRAIFYDHSVIRMPPTATSPTLEGDSSAPTQSDDALPSITTWPFYWLTRAVGRYVDSVTSALDGTSLDLPTWRVLMTLKDAEWLSVSEIAAQSNTKLAAMTKTVQRMKAEGLVQSREGEVDRRVTLVSLTPAGLSATETATNAARHVYRRAFHGMTADQQDRLSALLRDLAENLR